MNLRNHFRFLCYISQCEDDFCSARHKTTNKRCCCLLHQSLLIFVSLISLRHSPAALAHYWSSCKVKSTGLEIFIPAVKTRWSFDFFLLLFLCKQLLWEREKENVHAGMVRGRESELLLLSKSALLCNVHGCWGGGGRGEGKKKSSLIKIQLGLTFSLLPFQSFYSFKSLTISVTLKR